MIKNVFTKKEGTQYTIIETWKAHLNSTSKQPPSNSLAKNPYHVTYNSPKRQLPNNPPEHPINNLALP